MIGLNTRFLINSRSPSLSIKILHTAFLVLGFKLYDFLNFQIELFLLMQLDTSFAQGTIGLNG